MKRDAIVPAITDSPLSNLAHFGFLTLPNFSMIAFTSAVEVLRMANYVGHAEHYTWSITTPDGEPARASNGIIVKPTKTLDEAGMPDVLVVCTGWHVANYVHVRFADELFVIDRDRFTCTGGTAPLDLMLNLVSMQLRQKHATQVSEQFIVERIRGSTDYQHIPIDARVGFSRAELVEVVRLMEVNIEEPLSREELARLVHLSQRHLQRMFKMFLSVSPTHYYLTLRLRRARELLRNTDASIARVTSVCGFHSPCHFSKAYRAQFGHAPSVERRLSA